MQAVLGRPYVRPSKQRVTTTYAPGPSVIASTAVLHLNNKVRTRINHQHQPEAQLGHNVEDVQEVC